jgi:putative ABC transport system ATP-binding protein
MVTHDPNAASYADRVIFLGDGQVVDEMREPTAESVLDRLKHLDVHLPDPTDPVTPPAGGEAPTPVGGER